MYFHHTMTRNFAIDPAFSWDLFTFIAEKAVFFLRKTILLAENGIRVSALHNGKNHSIKSRQNACEK